MASRTRILHRILLSNHCIHSFSTPPACRRAAILQGSRSLEGNRNVGKTSVPFFFFCLLLVLVFVCSSKHLNIGWWIEMGIIFLPVKLVSGGRIRDKQKEWGTALHQTQLWWCRIFSIFSSVSFNLVYIFYYVIEFSYLNLFWFHIYLVEVKCAYI
jgi:apolipoprotein N-acyltransferase